jgi:hypothetical protein
MDYNDSRSPDWNLGRLWAFASHKIWKTIFAGSSSRKTPQNMRFLAYSQIPAAAAEATYVTPDRFERLQIRHS